MRFAVFICIAVLLVVLMFAGLNRELVLQYHPVDLGFAQYKILLFPITVLIAGALIVVVLLAAQLQIALLRRRLRRLEEQTRPSGTDFNLGSNRGGR